MTLQIQMLTLGIAATNCYIIGDTETNEAILIDPVDNADVLHQTATEAGWTIKLILGTHGHFDHILASKALKDVTNAPFWIHEKSQVWLDSMPEQGMMFTGHPFPKAAQPDRFLKDEPETIKIGNITLETLFTPGHAPGHLCFFMPEHQVLFGGDCLFAGSIGRTDLPYCDHDTLMQSIIHKILPLGDEVQILPGHGEATTIGREWQTNPFILDYLNRL